MSPKYENKMGDNEKMRHARQLNIPHMLDGRKEMQEYI